MLTGGNYIQIRQVMLRFATQYRQSIGTHSLKENVESAMNYLSNHGYGTLQDKVFYENPHLSKEQLKTILVEPKEYLKSLKFVSVGFSKRKGKHEACTKVHTQLYGKREQHTRDTWKL